MRFTDNNAITAANMVDADILAGTDVSTGEDKKFPVGNLADYMLANRTQPVGGANQSITSALNAANNKADTANGKADANTTAISNLETAVDKKANADGEYDNLVVGTSKQLLSDSYTEDFTPYKFRKSPYTDRLSESIVGASVAWNQLVNTSDTSVTVPSGHKYLSRISGTDAMGASTGTAITVTGTDNVHDLTAMFGTTVADALYAMGADGVALFRSWYPKPYYPYSAPTLEHVSGLEAHEMVGFNQWNEEWEVGGISNTDGTNVSGDNRIRSKNYIPILSGNNYYFVNGGSYTAGLRFYDSNKNYIGADTISTSKNLQYGSRYLPSGTAYLRFILIGTVTYNHDICINLSDPTRNGQYKPYSKHSYALDASLTLMGILKYDSTKGIYADGDTYNSDGTVDRRYGIVDLGTLNWNYVSGVTGWQSNVLRTALNYTNVNFISDKYICVPWAQRADGCLTCVSSGRLVLTDASQSLPSPTGQLVYPLAAPTTESAEPFDAIQITDGTEEYVTDCLAPVGHESKYYQNLRSKIEGLPTDFSAIICATEATNKASRNYAVGDYLIYGNTLYKVTTAIAANATLTVGTNITATTIMAEIKALQ